jgi:hypothetical protein
MDSKNEYELVVSEGKLPLWRAVVAAAFFTCVCYILYLDFQLFYYTGFNQKSFTLAAKSLEGFGYCLVGGITFCVTKTILIDVDNDKLISRFCVGPFTRNVLDVVPELEYMSVFKNGKGQFEANLWYKGNKHYKMYRFDEKAPAMAFGREVAKKLKIDLLDATQKGNSQWIELPQE